MIDQRRELHDAVAEADVLSALAARGEENFRRRRMRILFEEMMLGRPYIIEAEAVGEFDLIKRIFEQPMLRISVPWSGNLMLVETADFHWHLDAGRTC